MEAWVLEPGWLGGQGKREANPSLTRPPSGDDRRGVVVIDHVTVGGGVWAAAGRRGAPLVFNLQPGLAQCLGEVVVHRARDGHWVGGGGLGLLVVLPKTAAEMLFDHRVTGCVGVDSPVAVREAWAAVVRNRTVRQVAVAVVSWGACDHWRTILLALHGTDCVRHCCHSRCGATCRLHRAVFGECQWLVHAG